MRNQVKVEISNHAIFLKVSKSVYTEVGEPRLVR